MADPLRVVLDELEQAKDAASSEPGRTGTFLSDAKEAYYLTVAFVQTASRDETPARPLLEAALSAWSRVDSELGGASLAAPRLRQAVVSFRDVAASLLPPVPDGVAPTRVVELRDGQYVIRCSVCGTECAAVGPDKSGRLRYQGITDADVLDAADAAHLFPLLDAGDLREAHQYLAQRYRDVDMMGIDAYCPECDLTYCRRHYSVVAAWDDGFYDDARGTCPRGHQRILDD